MDYNKEFEEWVENATDDTDLIDELKLMSGDEKKIEDAFYRNLAFGTGGLRGVIGAGTNRMNIYTVAKASQGLANYIIKKFPKENRKIAISYDSRIKSDLFSKISAEVFSANGIKSYIYKALMPTPCLSYAVRSLGCSAGIMVTASHNPCKYNGYKVYGEDGCQITTIASEEILSEIERIRVFEDVQRSDFDESINNGMIEYISEKVYNDFIVEVQNQTPLSKIDSDMINKNLKIIYTPLNGTGLRPVVDVLKRSGYTNIFVVPEQEMPDGNFTTCPYPNPEIEEAMSLGIKYATEHDADLLLATDPDCDRVGIAVKDSTGCRGECDKFVLLTGNETGVLLFDFICKLRERNNTLPKNPVLIKTIVTTDMGDQIAKKYGVQTINVLTGFKFIGEQIGLLEKKGDEGRYIFGFEESYGYLSGSYVRDKDGVNAAFLICEMFAYYKMQGISLLDKLDELYKEYGYCLNTLHSFQYEGSDGLMKMNEIVDSFRGNIESFGKYRVLEKIDYQKGIDGLPVSNVIRFSLENNISFVVRPSGTEPKLKIYVCVVADSPEVSHDIEKELLDELRGYLL